KAGCFLYPCTTTKGLGRNYGGGSSTFTISSLAGCDSSFCIPWPHRWSLSLLLRILSIADRFGCSRTASTGVECLSGQTLWAGLAVIPLKWLNLVMWLISSGRVRCGLRNCRPAAASLASTNLYSGSCLGPPWTNTRRLPASVLIPSLHVSVTASQRANHIRE